MTIAASEPSDAAAMLDFGSNVTLSWKHLSRIFGADTKSSYLLYPPMLNSACRSLLTSLQP